MGQMSLAGPHMCKNMDVDSEVFQWKEFESKALLDSGF